MSKPSIAIVALLLAGCASAPQLSGRGSEPLVGPGPVAVLATDSADPLERDAAQALRTRLQADGVAIVEPNQASRLLQVGLVRTSRALEVGAPAAVGAEDLDFGAAPRGVRRWFGAKDTYRLSIASLDRATGRLVTTRWASLPAKVERPPLQRLIAAALAEESPQRR